MSKTFTFLKPDVFVKKLLGPILLRLDEAGFVITQYQLRTMSKEQAELFYAEHKGKSFFEDNIKFITSGTCLGLVLEKKNAVQDLRKLIGDTDPKKAEKGTIRCDFGDELPRNIIHASADEESVEREINVFFDYELKTLLGKFDEDEIV